MQKVKFNFILLVFTVLLSVENLLAQALELQNIPKSKMHFGLSFNKSYYSDNHLSSSSALSGTFQLSINVPISEKLNIVGNIPYVNTDNEFNYEYGSFKYKKNGFGNVYLGMQTNPEAIDNRRTILSFGVYLPTANEDASYLGIYINYYEIQKYLPNSLGLYFNYAYHKYNTKGIFYGLEGGPTALIATENNTGGPELLVHYRAILGIQYERFSINTELLGIAILTQDTPNFTDKFFHSIGIGAGWHGNSITPKIGYKVYLDNHINDIVDGVLELSFLTTI